MINRLQKIYTILFKAFGPQHWWPGETPFEVAVGAILTQNTNWGNVEKAIINLKKAGKLKPYALHEMSHSKLAALIKPAGYFNIKAKRLKNFISFLVNEYDGSMSKMKKTDSERTHSHTTDFSSAYTHLKAKGVISVVTITMVTTAP